MKWLQKAGGVTITPPSRRKTASASDYLEPDEAETLFSITVPCSLSYNLMRKCTIANCFVNISFTVRITSQMMQNWKYSGVIVGSLFFGDTNRCKNTLHRQSSKIQHTSWKVSCATETEVVIETATLCYTLNNKDSISAILQLGMTSMFLTLK